MDLSQIVDFGATGLVAFVLYLIVKMFINYLKKRDDSFGTIISNHMSHNTEALTRLLEFLKNGSKK
jgi:hypothetical protein|tara:strand:+ start:1291 stop:1488 length:198 start_codon:yes stop_codon:yes gene_type:complete